MLRPTILLLAGVLLPLFLGGCTTARRLEKMESRVRTYLDAAQRAEFPLAEVERLDVDAYRSADTGAFAQPLTLDLRRSLELAAKHSRRYQSDKENLYSSAISLYVLAHQYEWGLSQKSLEASLTRDLAGDESTTLDGGIRLGATRTLMSGAVVGMSLGVNALRFLSGDHSVDIWSTAQATLTQPLLRNRGRLLAREPLTQAERNLVYALRTYVRARKELILSVSDSYYNVISAIDGVTVARRNYENRRASRERAEWQGRAGQTRQVQVDQARQRELTARSSLLSAELNLQDRKDALKQLLGLPLSVTVEANPDDLKALIAADLPSPPMTLEQGVEQALANRLDFATVRDKLEDAVRNEQIRKDALRTKLDLELATNASSPHDGELQAVRWSKGRYSAGLVADLPWDQRSQLRSYREACIDQEAAERAVEQKRDEIISRVRTDWRNLQTGKENYQIEQMSVELARKRVESTEMELAAGRVNMRDVLEAQDDLTTAQNNVTRALITHRKNWLRLLVDLETLPAEPDTLWSPALEVGPTPPAAPAAGQGQGNNP